MKIASIDSSYRKEADGWREMWEQRADFARLLFKIQTSYISIILV